jgi:type II secretory pathway component PulC
MRYDLKKIVILGASTFLGVIAAIVVLMMINASFLRMPDGVPQAAAAVPPRAAGETAAPSGPDYGAITQRNLFRAKLQVEIPKPKTGAEIEEERLTAIVRTMALKGVVLGVTKRDNYAIIDRGGQKGVWVYEAGEFIEDGLALREIRKDSVRLEKGDFGAVLRLFSSAFERTGGPGKTRLAMQQPAVKAAAASAAPGMDDIKREGAVTRVSKALADQLKADNKALMSSIAVKAGADGVKVVSVDHGSIAQRMGIAPDDTLQEVNGLKLSSSEDMNKVYEALKNATTFEVKVLRRGHSETLRYEIR